MVFMSSSAPDAASTRPGRAPREILAGDARGRRRLRLREPDRGQPGLGAGRVEPGQHAGPNEAASVTGRDGA